MNRSAICALLLALVLGCGAKRAGTGPIYGSAPVARPTPRVYRFAPHPLHNPEKLNEVYQPLIAYLNRHIQGASFELETSRDYQAFEAKYHEKGIQFLLPNPWQTLDAMKVGYTVLAMAGDPGDFKGIILVRRDSGITRIADLRGRIVAYPAPTALAACMMTQLYFQDNGLDPRKDVESRFVGSQESSILNVQQGLTAACGTWPPPWRAFQKDHPQEAAELRLAFETPSLVNNSIMARSDVPQALRDRVRTLLLGLKDDPEGRALLQRMETSAFLPADNTSYDAVRKFMTTFEQRVRTAEQR